MAEPLRFREPMARHVSWRAGGPADRFFVASSVQALVELLKSLPKEEPLLFLGLGSNLLVRDGGFRGTVVLMHSAKKNARMDGGLLYAGAGVASPKVARFAALQHLTGAEFLAGIPGTVGGALAMNAGCYGGETWDIVQRVFDHRPFGVASRETGEGLPDRLSRLPPALRGGGVVRGSLVHAGEGRRRGIARAHQGAPREAHGDAAAAASERRQRVPQSAGRPRRPADRVLRPEGARARRRARVGEARQLHRQPRWRRERFGHRGADSSRQESRVRADRRRSRSRGADRGEPA